MAEETKRCPLCYEVIHSKAIKCKHCGSVLDGSDSSPSSSYPSERGDIVSVKEAPPVPGEKHVLGGRYELTEELGRGGMGIVYKGYDTELGIDLAIKLLPEYLTKDRRGVESLKREALASMKLSHPNIIRFYHFEDRGDEKFLIMEFVDGKTLDEILDESPDHKLSEEAVVKYAIDASKALSYAHSKGVIHRDIKPSNIMLNNDDEIKIGDFGIARVLRESHTRHTGSTTSGTLLYMSPEHILGQKCDARSDIYSLGISLYELLNGEVPFRSGDIVTQHREVIPKAIEGISDRLNWIVLKCLEKPPEERWQTVTELVDVLEGRIETEPEREERERQEAERKEKEEEEQRKREQEEAIRRRAEERARQEAERKAREEEKQRKREQEEEEARRQAEERERQEAERRAREEEEQRKREQEEAARRRAEEIERQKHEAERRAREAEEQRKRAQQEAAARRQAGVNRKTQKAVGSFGILLLIIVIAVVINRFREPGENAAETGTPGQRETTGAKPPPATIPENMVWISDGEFMMGSPSSEAASDERPRHRVSVDAFYMDTYEVANREYKAFLDATGYDGRVDADSDYLKHWEAGTYPPGESNHPVVYISWKNAQAYAEWAGKRLPTEAEWEYACRAGTETKYYSGNIISHNDANYKGTGGKDTWSGTAPVGDFAPNPWGLYDMHGNVWEWCADFYSDEYYSASPEHNPQGPTDGRTRVFRGGSWREEVVDIRSANRGYFNPDGTENYLGFRCVKDLE